MHMKVNKKSSYKKKKSVWNYKENKNTCYPSIIHDSTNVDDWYLLASYPGVVFYFYFNKYRCAKSTLLPTLVTWPWDGNQHDNLENWLKSFQPGSATVAVHYILLPHEPLKVRVQWLYSGWVFAVLLIQSEWSLFRTVYLWWSKGVQRTSI